MSRVGFLGLGVLGRPMAERLIQAGHQVVVWNRTAEKTGALVEAGASAATSAAAAITGSDFSILMLRDGPVTKAVLGDVGNAVADRTLIQMATIAPHESLELGGLVVGRGGRYLEAPVLGSVPQARAGTLQVLAAGESADIERARDLLSAFGTVRAVGPLGAGATMKLALNQLIPTLASAFALSLGMIRRSGADLEIFLDVLRQSTFHAKTFDQKLPMMQSRDFSATNFPAELMLKDVELVLEEATRLGLETAVVEGVRSLYQKTVERGAGRSDYSSLYETVDRAD
jgi:3-hydroxyisobutyrate dehydrogenase-like beta-hydroxyacid dehydrogenase